MRSDDGGDVLERQPSLDLFRGINPVEQTRALLLEVRKDGQRIQESFRQMRQ